MTEEDIKEMLKLEKQAEREEAQLRLCNGYNYKPIQDPKRKQFYFDR